MNKKGYTIIEILLVIAIISAVAASAVVSYIEISKKQKEKDYVVMIENIKTASELYLQKETDYKALLTLEKKIVLPIKLLVEENYLSNYYSVNPKTNESVIEKCIDISLGTYSELEFSEEVNPCENYLVFDPNPIEINTSEKSKIKNIVMTEIKKGIKAYDSNNIELTNPSITYPTEVIDSEGKVTLIENITNVIKTPGLYKYKLIYVYDGNTFTRNILIDYLNNTSIQFKDIVINTSPSYPSSTEALTGIIEEKIKNNITLIKGETVITEIEPILITYPTEATIVQNGVTGSTVKISSIGKESKNYKLIYKYGDSNYTRNLIINYISDVTISSDNPYTPEASGYYNIIAYGAQGSGPAGVGGKGGIITGTIYLNAPSEVLSITIGEQKYKNSTGGTSSLYYGGGATIVKKLGSIILAAAGGGGGVNGTNGSSSTSNAGLGGACGTNYNTSTTCINGGNGSNLGLNALIGGGGSSGYYYGCAAFVENYDPCLYGENTCEPGYDDIRTRVCTTVPGECTTITTCKSCSSTTCTCSGYHNPIDDECHGGSVSCKTSRVTSCSKCGSTTKQSCTDSTQSCSWDYDSVYNPCKTGHNTCEGGYVPTTTCKTPKTAASYTSGNGGINYYTGVVKVISNSTGNSGNGKVEIQYMGDVNE